MICRAWLTVKASLFQYGKAVMAFKEESLFALSDVALTDAALAPVSYDARLRRDAKSWAKGTLGEALGSVKGVQALVRHYGLTTNSDNLAGTVRNLVARGRELCTRVPSRRTTKVIMVDDWKTTCEQVFASKPKQVAGVWRPRADTAATAAGRGAQV